MEVRAKLKKCPHCGREATVKDKWVEIPPYTIHTYYGYCERCHLAGEPSLCEDFAVYNWNEELSKNVR